jgi:hypothetical protein
VVEIKEEFREEVWRWVLRWMTNVEAVDLASTVPAFRRIGNFLPIMRL